MLLENCVMRNRILVVVVDFNDRKHRHRQIIIYFWLAYQPHRKYISNGNVENKNIHLMHNIFMIMTQIIYEWQILDKLFMPKISYNI